jgi:hypothetical protein
MKPEKDGGTLPGDLMTQEILQTRDQKQKIEGQSKIKQDRVGLAMPLLTAMSQIQTLGKA